MTALLRYTGWPKQGKAGELMVGYNNIGEIRFIWTEAKKAVVQRLWYANDDDGSLAQDLQHTEYAETLELPELDAAPWVP